MDMKLEVAVLPVWDVDRTKEFCARLGCRLDLDFAFDNGCRVGQYATYMVAEQVGTELPR